MAKDKKKKSKDGERRPKNKKSKGGGNASSISITAPKEFVPCVSHDWYKASFEELKFGEGRYDQEYARFSFKLKNGELEDGAPAKGLLVSAMCNKDFAPGQKAFDYLCAIVGSDLSEDDDDIDATACYGDVYEVFIENKTNKTSGKTHSNVTRIRAVKAKKKKKKSKK